MKTKVFLLFASLFITSAGSQANPFANYKDMLKSDKYSNYASVTLLDSTNVSVQPTGQGAFSVVKAIKIQNQKGVMTNRVLKYDYDPLTAAAKFKVFFPDFSLPLFVYTRKQAYRVFSPVIYIITSGNSPVKPTSFHIFIL